MKKTLSLFLVLFTASFLVNSSLLAFQSDTTTLIFVRHAEKASDGTRNPPLNEEGEIRAVNLFHSLTEFDVKAIFSTPYKRTEMTSQPTADSLGLEINTYGLEGVEDFLTKVIQDYKGGTVLIVGHSNTTPALVNMVLGRREFEQIDESQYGDMFIVTATMLGAASVETRSF